MRFIFVLGMLLLTASNVVIAQKSDAGPIIGDFGEVYAVPEADLILKADRSYKVLFDIYTDPGEKGDMNPLLNTVARFINMHGQTGLSMEQMKIAVVLHGAGVRNVLNDKTYNHKFKRDNPNTGLLEALDKVGVELYVCGQSLSHGGYARQDLAEPVKVSLSAMTALVHYQEEGYQIINFN